MHTQARFSGCLALLLAGSCVASLRGADAPSPSAPPPPPAVVGPPRTLSLEVTVIRFKPDTKDRVLANFVFTGGASNVVDQLKGLGKSVDVIYRGTRDLVLEDKSKAVFDATETRPVLLIGQPGAPVPPATIYGLKLEVTVRPGASDRFALFWEGSLTWSPELMDRRGGVQNTMQFVGKAAAVAQQASQFAGDAKTSVNQAAEIGLTLAQLFSADKPGANSIYELPVIKTLGLTGSRYCRSGEVVSNTTAAEVGTKEPQMIIVMIDPFVRD